MIRIVKYPRVERGGFYAVPMEERTRHGLRGAPPAPVERCQQHGNVFTRRTDLRRNLYVISLSKCSASLHWGGDTLPSYGSTHLFFLGRTKAAMRLTHASRQGGCAAYLLKAMLNALWISFLFALCLIIISVPDFPMLIASEMMLVVLFSLLCWKPTAIRDAWHGIKVLLGLELGTYAGPRHTYPIRSEEDVQHALRLVGRAENPETVKRKIIAIARYNGYALPEEWEEPPQNEMQFGPADWLPRE